MMQLQRFSDHPDEMLVMVAKGVQLALTASIPEAKTLAFASWRLTWSTKEVVHATTSLFSLPSNFARLERVDVHS